MCRNSLSLVVALSLTFLAAAPSLAQDPTFSDQRAAAGIHYTQNFDDSGPIKMSGGAGACDLNADGLVDLYVTRHAQTDILYLNDGLGGFVDGTAAAFPGGTPANSNGVGCADIDNDGDTDLYLTGVDSDRYYLYINDGAGVFSEDAVARGADLTNGDPDKGGFGVSFGDCDDDGYLDLYVGEWSMDAGEPPGTAPVGRLLRNLGAASPGHFEDITDAAGVSLLGVGVGGEFSFAPAFVDLDEDGRLDLALTNDFNTTKLFWNEGACTFSDGTAAGGITAKLPQNGMGAAFADFDGDTLFDWYATSIYDLDNAGNKHGNTLYQNLGGRSFTEIASTVGVDNGFWSWQAAAFDYDNDRDNDIVATNGWVAYVGGATTPMRLWRNDLWRNSGGSFTERSAAAGMTDTGLGRGLLTFDYDQDGDLDVFVSNNAAQPVLYRNDGGNLKDWLRLKLRGHGSPSDPFGALITVRPNQGDGPQLAQYGVGSHFNSQSELVSHFGLGDQVNPVYSVRVDWPSGSSTALRDVAMNQQVEIHENTATDGGSSVRVSEFGRIEEFLMNGLGSQLGDFRVYLSYAGGDPLLLGPDDFDVLSPVAVKDDRATSSVISKDGLVQVDILTVLNEVAGSSIDALTKLRLTNLSAGNMACSLYTYVNWDVGGAADDTASVVSSKIIAQDDAVALPGHDFSSESNRNYHHWEIDTFPNLRDALDTAAGAIDLADAQSPLVGDVEYAMQFDNCIGAPGTSRNISHRLKVDLP
jgi:hypothetical protein